jgi:hypothetical protein
MDTISNERRLATVDDELAARPRGNRGLAHFVKPVEAGSGQLDRLYSPDLATKIDSVAQLSAGKWMLYFLLISNTCSPMNPLFPVISDMALK